MKAHYRLSNVPYKTVPENILAVIKAQAPTTVADIAHTLGKSYVSISGTVSELFFANRHLLERKRIGITYHYSPKKEFKVKTANNNYKTYKKGWRTGAGPLQKQHTKSKKQGKIKIRAKARKIPQKQVNQLPAVFSGAGVPTIKLVVSGNIKVTFGIKL